MSKEEGKYIPAFRESVFDCLMNGKMKVSELKKVFESEIGTHQELAKRMLA